MNNIKNYMRKFIKDESGMEIMQAVGIIVLTVGLLAAIFVLGRKIIGYINDASSIVDTQFQDMLNGGNNNNPPAGGGGNP